MVILEICVGSSCHLKGSYEVAEAIKKELRERNLGDKVTFRGAFCLGKCEEAGVAAKVNDKIVTGLTPESVPAFFEKEVMPLIKQGV
jgi:NADH:ubiquinone oxidoreductase subunit E